MYLVLGVLSLGGELSPEGGMGGGALSPGVTLSWGVSAHRGVSDPERVVCSWGVSVPGGKCLPHTTTPPVNRMTDACENITLPQLRCGR